MSNLYHRGDNVFLYVKFKDKLNKPINVTNARVKIIHENKNGDVIIDFPNDGSSWFPLTSLSSNEYFANYVIPHDADYATYEIIYSGEYEDEIATAVENFRIIPFSEKFEEVIKLYGNVHQLNLGNPLEGVYVEILRFDESEVISQSYTNADGLWESFVYPGEYKIYFKKYGFITQDFTFQVGLENEEVQFDNVALESENSKNKGTGVYTISDKYTTREGMAITGLNVKAYNVIDPTVVAGQDLTNHDGKWELFLDPGTYLLKVTGKEYDDEFDQTFRLKIREDGDFSFEDLASNVAVPSELLPIDDGYVGNGNGSVEVSDVVLDENGNPIVDVQVNFFYKGNLDTIIAQDYTNKEGKWTIFVNPGSYVVEYYHPAFDVVMEDKIIQ